MFSMRTFLSTKGAVTLKRKQNKKKARHRFSKEVSWDIPADFQPIPSEDARKQTENVHPSMQFSFIEKKTKNLFRDFYD